MLLSLKDLISIHLFTAARNKKKNTEKVSSQLDTGTSTNTAPLITLKTYRKERVKMSKTAIFFIYFEYVNVEHA